MNDEKYSRNQCTLIIRVDGEETVFPINFGMTADEIKTLYPYLLPLVNTKIENPAVAFLRKFEDGKFDNMSTEDCDKLIDLAKIQSKFWFDKPEAGLLEIALRLALDIKLRDIRELDHIFDAPSFIDNIDISGIKDIELEDEVDLEAFKQQGIPLGTGGDVNVDLYNEQSETDKLSQQLDEMESNIDIQDKFDDIVNSELDEDDYKSTYEFGGHDNQRIKDVVDKFDVDIYDDDNESKLIFDKMNEKDGLNDIVATTLGEEEEEINEVAFDDDNSDSYTDDEGEDA